MKAIKTTNTRLFYLTISFFLLIFIEVSAQEGAHELSPSNSENTINVWDWKNAKETIAGTSWQSISDYAFSPAHKWQTNGVVIIKDDHILFEKYAHGFEANTPHRVWSISKSFTSALIGIRWQQLGWSFNKFAHELLNELKGPIKDQITMRHLLTMSSGLDWNEFYEKNPFQSHVVDMLYINNYKDMGLFTAKRPMKRYPGTFFNYSSGETNLIMRLLKQTFEEEQNYETFPWKELFNPLGITSATWEQDLANVYVGSSYLFMNARDLARFGRLYLNKGKWQENSEITQIVSERFVRESLKTSPAVCQTYKSGLQDLYTYGFQWWLNRECPNKKKRIYPELPQDVFMALGHHGQMLVVIPSENAIVVRFGADKKKRFPKEKWMAMVYKALKETSVRSSL